MNRGAHLQQRGYVAAAIALFAIEAPIAFFVRDDFVRPYVGDVLAVMLVYAARARQRRLASAHRSGWPWPLRLRLRFRKRLVWSICSAIARIVLGGVFDWADMAAYVVGGMIVAAIEFTLAGKNAEEGEHG